MASKKITTHLLLWCMLLVAAFANAQTFNGSTVNTAANSAIPSAGTGGCGVEPQTAATGGTRFNASVAGVTAGNVLTRVSVNFTHTWDSDVNMWLVSPSGAVLELSTGNGGSGDNFTNTNFCDGPATSITAGAAPFTGDFRPEGSLTTFTCGITVTPTVTTVAGMGATAGTWQLLILDNAGGDVGTMLSWSLVFAPNCSFTAATLPALNLPGNSPTVCGAVAANVTAPALTCTGGTGTMDVRLNGTTIATGVPSGGTFQLTGPSGSHTLTYVLPNCTSRTQALTITDGVGPVLTCPGNQTYNLGPGECRIAVNYDVFAVDNCNPTPMRPFQTTSFVIFSRDTTAAINANSLSCGPGAVTNHYFQVMPSVNSSYMANYLRLAVPTTGGAGATVTVRLYTLTNTATPFNVSSANRVLIGTSAPFTITAAGGQKYNVPLGNINVPAGATVLVEVETDRAFVISTPAGSGTLTWIGAPACGLSPTTPSTFASIGFALDLWAVLGGIAAPTVVQTSPATPQPSGSNFEIGTTRMCFTARDASNNTSTCCFDITVREFPNAVTSLVCNDNVQVSLDEDCSVALNADQILEGGPYRCYEKYVVQLDKTAPYNNGPWSLGTVTSADINKTYGVRVFDDRNGNGQLDVGENVCWGGIKVEDKLPPVLACPTILVPCNTDLTPGTAFNAPANFAFPATTPPDGNATGTTRTIAVNVGTAPVVDFSVKVTTNHTWVGDVIVRLTAPNGTTVTLFDRPGVPASAFGCANAGLDVVFSDGAATPYSTFETTCGNNPAIAGTFQAFQALAPLLTGGINGNWTASYFDLVGGDNGAINVTLQFKIRSTFPLPNGLLVGQPGVTANADGSFTIAAGLGNPILDNCTATRLTYIDSKVDISCTPGAAVNPLTGVVTRKWTAVDASGNSATCNQTINLDRPALADIIPPADQEFDCLAGAYPTPEYIRNARGAAAAYPTFEGVAEGCSIGWTFTDAVVDVCDGTYKIRRKWVIIDWCTNNEREESQIIKVADKTGPVFKCTLQAPAFTTVAAAAAGGWLDIRADGPDAAYVCNGVTVPNNAPDTFYVFERAIAPLSGMVSQRIQCGALTGNVANTIEFVSGTDFNKCCATVDMPDVIVEDACSRIKSVSAMITGRDPITGAVIGMFSIAGTPSDFTANNWWTPDTLAKMGKTPCLPIGIHDVVYMAEDDCGNTAICTFRLRVADLIPPIVAADEFTQVTMGYNDTEDCYPGSPADSAAFRAACKFAGVVWIPAENFDDGSYDNCGPVRFTIRRMPKGFTRVGNIEIPYYSPFIEGLNKQDGCVICDPEDIFVFATQPTPAFPAGSNQTNTGFDPFGPTCIPGFAAWKPDEYQRAWLEQDSVKFYCDEVGTRDTVILRVYQIDDFGCPELDANGVRIFSEAMIAVDIVDKTRPSCTPPAHVTVSCDNFDPTLWAYGQAKADDNCCMDVTKVYQGVKGITHTGNYNQFDTSCNKGTIIRTFRSYDCSGNTAQCTQRVVVTYREDYYVRFPDDRIVTVCDGSGVYGAPTFFGEDCELLATSFKDDTFTVVPDACYKIERTWKVINWCTYDPNCDLTHVPNPTPNATVNNPANFPGPIVSNVNGCDPATINNPWRSACVRINPTDAANTSYTRFWQLPTNCWPTGTKFNGYQYQQIIKIVDGVDPVAQCVKPDTCDITDNDPNFWNVDYWWDPTHLSHDLCEMPIDLKLTATDACSGANLNFRYLLFLDLDGNGTMETVVSSSNLPGVNTIMYNNANNPNYTGGTARAFDHRVVVNPSLDWYRFAIQVTRSGANATAAVRFNTVRQPNNFVLPQIPHGKHKIKWIIEDGCGNETVCEYPFQIIDCKAPTVVCKPLSVNIMPTGMITLWASDFLEYTFDNCTPADQIKIAVSTGEPAPAAFPRDPATGLPITNVTFTCANLGANVVQLWAEDSRGNADYCQVVLLVQDNAGNCVQKATVAGELKTPGTQGVEEGNVKLAGSHPAFPPVELYQMSNQQGNYQFSNAIPLAGNYTLTPEKTDNPLNGVTTLDLALISKHILGVEQLNTPYKMIAADANKSGTITTFDVVELRKLILGIYDELPNNKSWRFVRKTHVFANPANPFTPAFPESSTVANIQASQMGEHFLGVKVGDVNGTAVANNLMSADDRTVGTTLFDVEDRAVKAGEVFEVKFKSAGRVPAYQFTMNHAGLEVVDIMPGVEMGLDNFGVFSKDAAVTTSWNGDAAQAEFTVKFRAAQNGQLSKMLGVSSRITKSMSYVDGEQRDVAFRFNNGTGSVISGVGFELYQNSPNPFVDKTVIGFHLPESTNAVLSVYDEAGKLVHRQEGAFAKGVNRFVLERSLVPTTGLLYYTVETSKDSATRKMIQSK